MRWVVSSHGVVSCRLAKCDGCGRLGGVRWDSETVKKDLEAGSLVALVSV